MLTPFYINDTFCVGSEHMPLLHMACCSLLVITGETHRPVLNGVGCMLKHVYILCPLDDCNVLLTGLPKLV